MSAAEFDPNLIRLPLDYQGTPELAEIRVTVPSIVPPDAGGAFRIGLELRDKWGFHLPKQAAPIAKVVVVKNNRDWRVVETPGWECVFGLDEIEMPQDRTDWYYVRVTQADGEMAWSSPIWLEDARRVF